MKETDHIFGSGKPGLDLMKLAPFAAGELSSSEKIGDGYDDRSELSPEQTRSTTEEELRAINRGALIIDKNLGISEDGRPQDGADLIDKE